MAALLGGLASLILGIIGIIIWWGYFVKALAAGIPIMLILGGALATYLGIEEWKDKRNAKKLEEKDNENNDTIKLKEEVEDLKKELKDLKKKD